MNDPERRRFDSLVDDAVDSLPARIRAMLEEVPLVVLDRPTDEMLRDLGIDPADEAAATELCGLHSGTPDTEAGLERSGELPSTIHLFRQGIVELAGGWEGPDADDEIYEEIRITLLHEIGHQFGLEEEDLEELGYD